MSRAMLYALRREITRLMEENERLVRENEELRTAVQAVHGHLPEVFVNEPSPLTLEENTDVE
jgi:regulator of replication initiation timing